MGETCNEPVAPGIDRGALANHRKRKRAYWRAYDRGERGFELMDWVVTECMHKMSLQLLSDLYKGPNP